jgi:hypothetical protein
VLDSAALFLALSPDSAPVVPARLCLRGGWTCFNEIARAMGFTIPDEPDVSAGISLSYEEFLDAVAQMRKVDFPIERHPKQAWQDFVGWRVNYEQAAYAIARELDAVPAMWSGPRRHPGPQIMPLRPGRGHPPKKKPAARADHRLGRGRIRSRAPGNDQGGAPASDNTEEQSGSASDDRDE